MHQANISYTRNHLSELLDRVRAGETILIVDRHTPIARLEPASGTRTTRALPWHADLARRGLVRPARTRLDPASLRSLPRPTAKRKGDILHALLADREEAR